MVEMVEGKTVVITAAGQGIGRAAAKAIARAGARAVATDNDVAKLGGSVSRLERRRSDVLDDAVFFADIGPADVLFHCAVMVHNGAMPDSTDRELGQLFDLTVEAGVHRPPADRPSRGHCRPRRLSCNGHH